jgi:hypothetical protein
MDGGWGRPSIFQLTGQIFFVFAIPSGYAMTSPTSCVCNALAMRRRRSNDRGKICCIYQGVTSQESNIDI